MKLRMVHRALSKAPPPVVPGDYRLRTFRPGDRSELVRLYRLGDLGVETLEDLTNKLEGHESFHPEHVFVIEGPARLAGTAAAFLDREDATQGFLHMVSVDPDHQGCGLGSALTCAALRLHDALGLRQQWLLTDAWRSSAIRLYLSLGYEPSFETADEADRWASALHELDRS